MPGSMPAIAPMRKHQSRGWNGSNRVGNYNGVPEHYKQLGSPLVCAFEFDADNFDRVTAKVQDWVASQSTKRNAVRKPLQLAEMERAVADLPTYKARRC
jgi:hypothetical protein